jgi:hypothetical protein
MSVHSEFGPLQRTVVDVRCSRSIHFDSGYTSEDIERILDDLIDATTQAKLGDRAGLMVSLALGLGGDDAKRSPTGTVLLGEPCSVLDARLDAVCALISRGLSLIDALVALPPKLRRRTDA